MKGRRKGRALPKPSRHQLYVLDCAREAREVSPRGMHAVTYASLARRGLVKQQADGRWLVTPKGETLLRAEYDNRNSEGAL